MRITVATRFGWYVACLFLGDNRSAETVMRALTTAVLTCVLISASAAHAEVMKIVLLGTGGPRPAPQRAGPAVLVQAGGTTLLFDSGRNVTTRLWEAGYSPADVNLVFLTHLHSDHVVGLADLWLTGWIWQRGGPLRVLGPAGTENLTRHLEAAHVFDRNVRAAGPHGLGRAGSALSGTDVKEGVVYRHGGITVTAFLVDHGPVAPAFGYRIDYGRRSVVISGDAGLSEELIEHSRGVDLLVHEVAAATPSLRAENPRLARILDYHTSPAEVAEILCRTQPRLAVLTHMVLFGLAPAQVLAEVRKRYVGGVEIGHDLLWVDIGEIIEVRFPGRVPKKNAAHRERAAQKSGTGAQCLEE